jgi:L-fucose mutarotase
VLIGIDPLLTPELLMILRAMGHGDEIAIVDGNYPAKSNSRRLVRLDGADASQALSAVLSVLPLDSFLKAPANSMQVVGKPREIPPAVADFQKIVNGRSAFPVKIGRIERFAFYERAKTCFAIVATTDRRLYANIILTKGVIGADGKVVVK